MEPQSTEEKILAAATKEFMQKGFDSARTTAIAKEAGVTHAMLHYYFRSKENLFEKIIDAKMSSIGELMLQSLSQSNLPLFERIRTAINRHLDFVSKNPELPHFFIREVYSHPERIRKIGEALQVNATVLIAELQKDIDEAAGRGECRRVNAEMLLLDIVSLNIFSFLAKPVLEVVLNDLLSDNKRFIEQRKIENFETIKRKLMICHEL